MEEDINKLLVFFKVMLIDSTLWTNSNHFVIASFYLVIAPITSTRLALRQKDVIFGVLLRKYVKSGIK